MVGAVANVLLETLRDLLGEEVKFLSGVSNKVTKVEADLRTIHGLLMKADSNRGRTDSPMLKNCIDELKELTFKAEKVLETYAVEVASKKEGKGLKKKLQRFMCILCEYYSVHQVGNEIDDIRSDLADITSRLNSIVGEGGSSNSANQEQRRLMRLRYAHEKAQHFVGMEKDIRSVVLMVNDTESSSVISICGMGGLGKTTLAREIYNHRDVQGNFDGRAWVCVTQQFQADTILRQIFKQIDGHRADKEATYDELVVELHNALVKRKCVIVIDDIWENNHWKILKPAFPTKNCKVVLTTRNQNIASQECHLHELDFLSEDEGWKLLEKIALPTINDDATQGQFFSILLIYIIHVLLYCSMLRYYEMTTTDFKSFENSKHLRILRLDYVEFEDGILPITIGKLIYLKYLSLYECNVKELPQYVCHLPYLQTLDLRVDNSIKLPNIISRMKRLRHLFLPMNIQVIGGDKLKLDRLNELETLEEINSKNVCIEDIVKLKNLRSLSATFEKDMDSLSKIVDYMSSNGCQLRETKLTVASCDLRNVLEKMLMSHSLIYLKIAKCNIECSFPSYKQGMCCNLVKLIIANCENIEGDVVELLGKYPMLRVLWLVGRLGEVEKNSEMRFGPNSFPELKFLYVNDVSNLHEWKVEKGAMIKLRELIIKKCRKLEKLPDELRFISTLERVGCRRMSEEFIDRMRRGENGEGGGTDYANFSHIPSLVVD